MDGFIDYKEAEFKQALLSTLRKHFDKDSYSDKEVYKTFKAQMKDKFYSLEEVPNKYIKRG